MVPAAAAAEWRPESDRWLGLPGSASETTARWTSGAGAAAAVAEVPHCNTQNGYDEDIVNLLMLCAIYSL